MEPLSCMPTLVAKAVEADGRVEVRSPAVGLWHGGPVAGAVLQPGCAIGFVDVLGVTHRILLPPEAAGGVVERHSGGGRALLPVEYGQTLLVLDQTATGAADGPTAGEAGGVSSTAELVLRAPTSGRFYARPAPDQEPFVKVGDVVTKGQTLCLIEVMKTFNRLVYQPGGSDGLPEQARITAIVPADGDDLDSGDPVLELEPA